MNALNSVVESWMPASLCEYKIDLGTDRNDTDAKQTMFQHLREHIEQLEQFAPNTRLIPRPRKQVTKKVASSKSDKSVTESTDVPQPSSAQVSASQPNEMVDFGNLSSIDTSGGISVTIPTDVTPVSSFGQQQLLPEMKLLNVVARKSTSPLSCTSNVITNQEPCSVLEGTEQKGSTTSDHGYATFGDASLVVPSSAPTIIQSASPLLYSNPAASSSNQIHIIDASTALSQSFPILQQPQQTEIKSDLMDPIVYQSQTALPPSQLENLVVPMHPGGYTHPQVVLAPSSNVVDLSSGKLGNVETPTVTPKTTATSSLPPQVSDEQRALALEYIDDIRKKSSSAAKSVIINGDKSVIYQCKLCPDKQFTSTNGLIFHYKKHAGLKPYVCETCSATFTRQHSLNYHMLIHMNKSRFVCSDCGRHFRHPSHFKEHMRRHTGETPFQCTDCLIR